MAEGTAATGETLAGCAGDVKALGFDGCVAYGAALNEGRALHAGDREFGEWVEANALRQVGGADIHDHERAAAMWAAANADGGTGNPVPIPRASAGASTGGLTNTFALCCELFSTEVTA